jgi:hypothetical protein
MSSRRETWSKVQKEMRLAALEVCANLVSWVYPEVISKAKDAGWPNPGKKSCEKRKKEKATAVSRQKY